MADSSIAGLFLDPYQYLQQQNQAVENQAMKFAQLSPMERATASIYSGANRLGGALAGAMGVEDPMLQQMSIRKKLASQFDSSSASGLIQLSQALREAGDMQGASQVAQQALLAREKEANIQAKIAEKLTPQQKNAAAMADSQYQRGTPEWMTAYNKNLSELANPEKLTTDQRNYDAAVQGGYKGSFNEWLMQKAKAGATNISLSATADKSYGSELGGLIAKKDVALFDAANAAPDILSGVKQQRDLLDSGKVLTGLGANAKLNVLAFGKALGVTGASDNEIIANTQQLQQQRAQATLNRVKASGLGTGQGFTDKDREFLEKAVAGNVTYDAETIRRQLQAEENAAKALAKGWNTRVKGLPEDVKRSMGLSEVSLPDLTLGTTAQIPTTSGPIYASNGKQRIVSTDGGRTWKPAQ